VYGDSPLRESHRRRLRAGTLSVHRLEGIQVFGISNPPTDTSPGGRINFRGGDWSSYWCNGLINESDARRGLYIWNVSAPGVRGPTVKLDYLNPQDESPLAERRVGSSGRRGPVAPARVVHSARS
jgi:hypothetical protein